MWLYGIYLLVISYISLLKPWPIEIVDDYPLIAWWLSSSQRWNQSRTSPWWILLGIIRLGLRTWLGKPWLGLRLLKNSSPERRNSYLQNLETLFVPRFLLLAMVVGDWVCIYIYVDIYIYTHTLFNPVLCLWFPKSDSSNMQNFMKEDLGDPISKMVMTQFQRGVT